MYTITRPSIMNFSKGCKVRWDNKDGYIVRMDGMFARILFENEVYKTVHYSNVQILEYVYTNNSNANGSWTQDEVNKISPLLFKKLTTAVIEPISKQIQRSEQAIRSKLQSLRKNQNHLI